MHRALYLPVDDVLITAGANGRMYLWHNCRCTACVPAHEGLLRGLALLPTGGRGLSTGGADGDVAIWSMEPTPEPPEGEEREQVGGGWSQCKHSMGAYLPTYLPV